MSVPERNPFTPAPADVPAPSAEGAAVEHVVFRGRWTDGERRLVASAAGAEGTPEGRPEEAWYGALWVCVRQEAGGRALYAAHRRGDCDVLHAATAGALARAMRRRREAPPTSSLRG